MNNTSTLHYSLPLIRRAIFQFWWRVVGWRFIFAILLITTALIALFIRGDRSWVVGLLSAVLFFGLLCVTALYGIHFNNAVRKFKAMDKPIADLSISEQSFTLSSGVGTTTLQWSAVTALWKFQDFWLLFFSKSQFVTLPLESISQESKDTIVKNIETSGGKVR